MVTKCDYCAQVKCDCGGRREVVQQSRVRGEVRVVVQCRNCKYSWTHWHRNNKGHARPKTRGC